MKKYNRKLADVNMKYSGLVSIYIYDMHCLKYEINEQFL